MAFALSLWLTGTVLSAHRVAHDDALPLRVSHYGNRTNAALVFVPCLSCGPWIWNAQIAALRGRYSIYVITLPGFDGMPRAAPAQLMTRATAAIHRLIHTERMTAPVLIGHSLGGTIAVLFGETYPADVSGIVTVEGGYPIAATQRERDANVALAVRPYEAISQGQLSAALRKNMLQYTITRPADADLVAQLAGRSDPRAVVDWMRAALSLDLTPALPRITARLTAIVPYDSDVDPYTGFKTEQAKRAAYSAWLAHAKNTALIMIPHSRHFVMLDQPGEFEAALERAIDRQR